MHHVPSDLVSSGHPMVLVNRLCQIFASNYLYKVKSRICSQGTIHLRCGHFYGLALRETTSCRFNNCIGFRQNLCENLLVNLFDFFFQLVNFVVNLLAFLDFRSFDGCFQLRDTCFFIRHGGLQFVHQCPRTSTQLIIRQRINRFVRCLDLVYYRLNGTHIFLRLVAE